MNNFELSQEAQEAMRAAGGWNLAGDENTPPATANDVASAFEMDHARYSFSDDIVEAAEQFAAGNTTPALPAQLEFNNRFAEALLGYRPPHNNLSNEQYNHLEATYDRLKQDPAFSNYRLIAAPVFLSDRELFDNRARILLAVRDQFPHERGLDAEQTMPLNTRGDSSYIKLLESPESSLSKPYTPNVRQGLRYRTVDGKDTYRSNYLSDLDEKGLAVRGVGNALWTYNFVDVRPHTPRKQHSEITARQLFWKRGSVVSTPEQELVVQALHLVGQIVASDDDPDINITNEATYYDVGNEQGGFLSDATGILWNADLGQVEMARWVAHDRRRQLGTRGMVRGL